MDIIRIVSGVSALLAAIPFVIACYSVETLERCSNITERAGQTIGEDPVAGVDADNSYKDPRIGGSALDDDECADLLSFLESLMDAEFVSAEHAPVRGGQ